LSWLDLQQSPYTEMSIVRSGYFYILVTVVFTVIGQLLVKVGVARVFASFHQPPSFVRLIGASILHPAVLGGLGCAFVAAIAWFPAISRLPISTAYPFMALPIVLVLLLSPLCFGEHVGLNQWLGILVVSFGLWLASR
jgi:drug/metabolite transporter (DMT)-like permease